MKRGKARPGPSPIEIAYATTLDGLRMLSYTPHRLKCPRSMRQRITLYVNRLARYTGVTPHPKDKAQTFLDCLRAIAKSDGDGDADARHIAKLVNEVFDYDIRQRHGWSSWPPRLSDQNEKSQIAKNVCDQTSGLAYAKWVKALGEERAAQFFLASIALVRVGVSEEAINACLDQIEREGFAAQRGETPTPPGPTDKNLAELQDKLSDLERLPENEAERFRLESEIYRLEQGASEWEGFDLLDA